jgi:hypothetical protein
MAKTSGLRSASVINSKGRIGRDGLQWFERLREEAEKHPELISEWQQSFLSSMSDRTSFYGEDTHWSEKQVNALTAIAERLGML